LNVDGTDAVRVTVNSPFGVFALTGRTNGVPFPLHETGATSSRTMAASVDACAESDFSEQAPHATTASRAAAPGDRVVDLTSDEAYAAPE
jgi:hypothetical protein